MNRSVLVFCDVIFNFNELKKKLIKNRFNKIHLKMLSIVNIFRNSQHKIVNLCIYLFFSI